ncbi:MAG: P-II family nitrogen regulator [Thaumarchaeota archaeon]|nr:MAG: P-II family nitrogen regulator [Nitrososphaerota archaeon]TLX83299.1 MAG: P-II family nitrogen regulator [Nitrososphaerota archaeon]
MILFLIEIFCINFSNTLIKAIHRWFGLHIMKKIEAIVPVPKVEAVASAILETGIGGVTIYDTKGRGVMEKPVFASGRGTGAYRPAYFSNSTIMVVAKDDMVDKIVEKIISAASTGATGEGKIFITAMAETIDIGSKKRGDSTL